MSKQEVYDLLYKIMETLPSELILLIREYMFFLPLTEEIRHLERGLTVIHIVPLATNRIILHDTLQFVLMEDDEITLNFQYKTYPGLSSLARYDNNSFVVANNNIIDKITISPNITKTQIIKIEDTKEILHMHTDSDGCILASGWNGIYVISQGKIIQHLFERQNCSWLRDDNMLEIYKLGKVKAHCQLFKSIKNIYRHKRLNEIPEHVLSGTKTFGARSYCDILSIQSAILRQPITKQMPSRIFSIAILHDKIYVLTSHSVHVFHEKLVTDDDLLKRQQNADT